MAESAITGWPELLADDFLGTEIVPMSRSTKKRSSSKSFAEYSARRHFLDFYVSSSARQGNADAYSGAVDMFNEYGFIQGRHNGKYRFDSQFKATNLPFKLNGNGCTFVQNVDGNVFYIENLFQNAQVVSAIADADLNLSGGGSTRVTAITVADGSLIVVNRMYRIGADTLNIGSDPSAHECFGEMFKAAFVSGNVVYTFSPLREAYNVAENVRIWEMQDNLEVIIDNVRFDCVRGSPTSWNEDIIQIEGAFAPKLSRIHTEYSYSGLIVLRSCYGAQGSIISARDLQTSSTYNRYGYGVVEYQCEKGRWSGLFGQNLRHLYTTGSSDVTSMKNTSKPWMRGRTANALIYGSNAVDCQNGAFSTHADAYNVTFDTCESSNAWRGPNGGSVNFAIRGQKNKVRNCVSRGGAIGVSAFMEYNDANNCQDAEIINHTHYCYPRGGGGSSYGTSIAISINGGFAGQQLRAVIVNPIVYGQSDTSMHVQFQYAKIKAKGGVFYAPHGGSASSARVYQVDATSLVDWDDWTVDYSGAVTTGLRTWKISDTSKVRSRRGKVLCGEHVAISSLTASGTTVTCVTTTPHGLVTGQTMKVSGCTPTQYNATAAVTVVDATTFTYVVASAPAAATVPGTLTQAFWQYLVDMQSAAGSATFLDTECDQMPTSATAAANAGSAVRNIIDLKADGGADGDRSVLSGTGYNFTAATTYSVSLDNCGARVVTMIIKATIAGATFNDLTPANVTNQRAVILNDPTSTQSFVLKKNGNINIPADVTLAPGDSYALIYVNSTVKWIKG